MTIRNVTASPRVVPRLPRNPRGTIELDAEPSVEIMVLGRLLLVLALSLVVVAITGPRVGVAVASAGSAGSHKELSGVPTITFDSFPDGSPVPSGTVLGSQYSQDGLVFLSAPPGEPPFHGGEPSVVDVGSRAHSGSQVASSCYACEGMTDFIGARLTTTRDSVAMDVGVEAAQGSAGPIAVKLEARDSSGGVLASVVSNVTTAVKTPMSIDPPGSDNVAYFDLTLVDQSLTDAHILIDDLTLAGGGVAAPDLAVVPERSVVPLTIGGTADVPIDVSRLNGSSGTVAMTATGLPSGASATFSPNPLTGTDARSTMHVTQDATTFALGNTSVTVTATPTDPTAGSTPRTTHVTFTVQAQCLKDVTIGLKWRITGLCIKQDGARYIATGAVRANGVDIRPNANAMIIVDPRALTLTTTGTVDVWLGSWNVAKDVELNWSLSKQPIDINTKDFKLLAGLPVLGDLRLTPTATVGQSQLSVTVTLPKALGGVSGTAVMLADDTDGLQFDGIEVRVGDARLGPLQIRNLDLEYLHLSDTWKAQATVVLPMNPPYAITAGVLFEHGQLYSANAAVDNLNVAIGSGVFLQKVSFAVQVHPHLHLIGGIGISVGPKFDVKGKPLQAVSLDGTLDFDLPTDGPWTLRAAGNLSLLNNPLVNGYVSYRSDGLFQFGGGVKWGIGPSRCGQAGQRPCPVALDGSLNGFVYGTKAFDLDGTLKACFQWKITACLEADAVVSNKGVAACGKVTAVWTVSVGFGYTWGGPLKSIMGKACDFGEWKLQPPNAAAAASASRHAIVLSRGLPAAALAISGTSRPPAVVLTGPHGNRIRTPSTGYRRDDHAWIVEDSDNDTTYVALNRPAAGRWLISTTDGSTITAVKTAGALPPVRIRAHVTGRGARRAIIYRIDRVPGQQVTFAERGTDHVVATVGGGSGRIVFAPRPGPGRTRQLLAIVHSYGLPRAELRVATYRAPGLIRLTRPHHARVRRLRGSLQVSWDRVAGAAGYEIDVVLADKRNFLFFRNRMQRSVAIPGITGATRATVTIAGISKNGTTGPPARISLVRS